MLDCAKSGTAREASGWRRASATQVEAGHERVTARLSTVLRRLPIIAGRHPSPGTAPDLCVRERRLSDSSAPFPAGYRPEADPDIGDSR